LFGLEGAGHWLEMAVANAETLATALREPDGGYAYRYYRCVDQMAPGCEPGEGTWIVDRVRNAGAQVLAQHLQAALAQSPARFVGSDSALGDG
jgi:hypothetical protein